MDSKWFRKQIKPFTDHYQQSFRIWKTNYTEEGGWVEHDTEFNFSEDGSMMITDKNSSDGFVSLTSEEVSYLLQLLKERSGELPF